MSASTTRLYSLLSREFSLTIPHVPYTRKIISLNLNVLQRTQAVFKQKASQTMKGAPGLAGRVPLERGGLWSIRSRPVSPTRLAPPGVSRAVPRAVPGGGGRGEAPRAGPDGAMQGEARLRWRGDQDEGPNH